MKKQPNQIRIRKPVFILIVLIFMLAIVTPVLADYLGPDRVTTESHVETFDVGVWAKDADGSCTPTHNPPACIVCRWEGDPGNACGDAEYSYKTGSQSEVVTTRIVLPPATITGTLQNCILQNGWCVTASELLLNSREPLPGHVIITIEGTLNGDVFACADTSCSVPLVEGNNNFTYWAISSWGDSSTKGVFTQKVDTVSPNVGLDVVGSNGANGWYISQTTVTATGADSTSGLYETLLSVDNGALQSSAVLNDGVYDIVVRAIDNAGNISNSSAIISVDTTTPSLNVSLNGTAGKNGWYISKVKASAIASDATSGIAFFEFSADGNAYQSYTAPISFSDGHHTYQFRATDNAGNITESPLQEVLVDTTFPAISLTEELSLGDTFYYDLQDEGSELARVRVVIEDEDERFLKVTWQEPLSGNKFKDEFLWDGKFSDGTQAPVGTYYVTIKATDSAGNESMKAGAVKVELFSFLDSIPAFTLPNSLADTEVIPPAIQNPSTIPLNTDFGGTTTQSTGTTSQSVLLSTGTASSTPTSSSSNVLWGAMAAAVIGTATAYALEEKRKRKEEEARQLRQAEAAAAKLNAAESSRKAQEWQDGQNTLNKLIEEVLAHGASAEEIVDLKAQAATQGLGMAINSADQILAAQNAARQKALDEFHAQEYKYAVTQAEEQAADEFHAQEYEYAVTQAEEQAAAELQAGLAAYYAGMKAGETVATNTVTSEAETTWWSNTLDSAWKWVFKNQVELSLVTGIVVGLAAVASVLLGIITAPAWLVIGGAVLVTAMIITAGTLVLNTHFDLDLGNNLATNLIVGTATTLFVAGVGLLLTSLAPFIGTTIVNTCTQYATACRHIGTIIDSEEEVLLSGQFAYYNWVGDQENAAQTLIELQFEQMDGGVPGNAVAVEIGQQITKLGDDAIDLVKIYGDDIVPLLLKYGDNASEVINLVHEFGIPAIKLLDTVDPTTAGKLLNSLDDDVLDYAMEQGPDAVSALSRWSDDELMKFGPELALRAKKDAKALDALNKLVSLGPIDPKNLTSEQQDLINLVAENSMQYADEGQIVLGKWVDYGNGFTDYARETGSVHYNPHPDMWNLLGELGEGNRDETAWLVNQQVIQIGIDKGLPFEYTLTGLPVDKIEFEEYAIEKIWEGGSSKEIIYANIKEALGVDAPPIRLKELVELYSAGYTYSFDNITNSYILIKP